MRGPCGACGRTREETRFWQNSYRCVDCERAHRRKPEVKALDIAGQRARYHRAPERQKARSASHYRMLRLGALNAYSNGTPACMCCGETILQFLAIDHIEGGGNKHRRELGVRGGFGFYRWLKKQGYPGGFQLLCHNCNTAKGLYGECPHAAIFTVTYNKVDQ